MTTLSVVVPCYNEQDGIAHLASALEQARQVLGTQYGWELVFVDDGSTDQTVERIQEVFDGRFTIQVVRHGRNRGLGAALRTGFACATGELVATMDSDCTYDPKELGGMLGLMQQGADLVVASPYHPQGHVCGVPVYRLFLSRNLSRLYNRVLGMRLYTFTSLFRLYRSDVIRTLTWRSEGYLAVVEMLVDAVARGYRVAEYPTTLSVRRYGQSKANLLLIGDHTRFLWQVFWRRMHRRGMASPETKPTR